MNEYEQYIVIVKDVESKRDGQ